MSTRFSLTWLSEEIQGPGISQERSTDSYRGMARMSTPPGELHSTGGKEVKVLSYRKILTAPYGLNTKIMLQDLPDTTRNGFITLRASSSLRIPFEGNSEGNSAITFSPFEGNSRPTAPTDGYRPGALAHATLHPG